MTNHTTVTTKDQGNTDHKRSFIKTAGNIAFAILMLISILLAGYTLQLRLLGEDSALLKFKIFIVLSGSMSPEFEPGSIVLVKDVAPENIAVGDILTFRPSAGSKNLVTHRVFGINTEDGLEITTKGDANDVQDPLPIYPKNVIGKVFMSVPYLGFVLNFAGTKYGFYSLIILPCLALIIYEIFRILTYLRPSGEQESVGEVMTASVMQQTETGIFQQKADKQIIAVPYRNPDRVFAGKASRAFASGGEDRFIHRIYAEKTEKEEKKDNKENKHTTDMLINCRNGLKTLLEEY